jgi:hypothetical protein
MDPPIICKNKTDIQNTSDSLDPGDGKLCTGESIVEPMIILNARGTKLQLRYNDLKKSEYVKTWYESCDSNQSKLPELYVNFSPDDINKFLDFLAYRFHIPNDIEDMKLAIICSYFGINTKIGTQQFLTIKQLDIYRYVKII